MNPIEIMLTVGLTLTTGFVGYAVSFINKLHGKIHELEKEIVRLQCQVQERARSCQKEKNT